MLARKHANNQSKQADKHTNIEAKHTSTQASKQARKLARTHARKQATKQKRLSKELGIQCCEFLSSLVIRSFAASYRLQLPAVVNRCSIVRQHDSSKSGGRHMRLII